MQVLDSDEPLLAKLSATKVSLTKSMMISESTVPSWECLNNHIEYGDFFTTITEREKNWFVYHIRVIFLHIEMGKKNYYVNDKSLSKRELWNKEVVSHIIYNFMFANFLNVMKSCHIQLLYIYIKFFFQKSYHVNKLYELT